MQVVVPPEPPERPGALHRVDDQGVRRPHERRERRMHPGVEAAVEEVPERRLCPQFGDEAPAEEGGVGPGERCGGGKVAVDGVGGEFRRPVGVKDPLAEERACKPGRIPDENRPLMCRGEDVVPERERKAGRFPIGERRKADSLQELFEAFGEAFSFTRSSPPIPTTIASLFGKTHP